MGTPNNELLTQLRDAIASWTSEVGAAQQGLSQQIDGANGQLSRLLVVLQERQQLTTALARANDEIGRLRQSSNQESLPPGAVTRYTVDSPVSPAPQADASLVELQSTIDRLQKAVQSWTTQVSHSQGGLLDQFATANRQLTQLLQILTEPVGSASISSETRISAVDPAVLEELEQLRHENRVLNSEVHALNIEMETFRLEQESFASANLAAETERVIKQRGEKERLEKALQEHERELASQRQEFETLSREAEGLRAETARLRISEERLQHTVDLQHQETVQHVTALGALSREMEALRRAFLGEDVQLGAPESDVPDMGDAAADGEALSEAASRIAALEAQVTQLEIERQEIGVLEERIATLKEALAAQEAPQDREEFSALQEHADSLEAALAAAPTPEEFAELRAELERLRDQHLVDSHLPASEDASAVDLERRLAELEAEQEILAARPSAEELAASLERASELECRIAELEAELEMRPAGTATEALPPSESDKTELEQRLAELEEERSALASRPTAEELAASAERAAELEQRLAELEEERSALASRPTAEELVASAERAAELEQRLAELEEERSALASRPTAEELAASAERAAELETRLAELEEERSALASRPTAEELAASAERAAELEQRLAELEEERSALASRPTVEELAEQIGRANTLEAALEQLRTDSHAAAEMASEATALREQLALMQSAMEELDERPEVAELDEARDRIADLEAEVSALNSRLTTTPEFQAETALEHVGLQAALAAMEAELASLKRKEEETVATARTLLVEMETHRTFEAAQATALSQARNEVARLQDALTERQLQIASLGAALASAESSRDELSTALAEANARQVDDTTLTELNATITRLSEENEAHSATANDSARLQSRIDAQAEELDAAMRAMASLQQELDSFQVRSREEIEGAAREREQLEDALKTKDARILALEADLPGHAESLMRASALEADLQSAREHIAVLEGQLHATENQAIEPDPALVENMARQEELLRQQATELMELRDSQQTAERWIVGLEQQLEERAREHAELQKLHADMTARYDSFATELELVRAQEAQRRTALADARAEAETALANAAAELEGKKAEIEALAREKASLSEETQARQDEIRETMAQMNQVLHERDELSEELDAEKSRRERIFAGTAGGSKNAAEAIESREERARQQEIILSELAQPESGRSLGDILVNAGILTREQLSDALEEQQKDPTQLLGTILIEREYTTDDAIAQAVACQLEKPVVNPLEVHIQKNALDAIHRDLCTWHVCIPLRITQDRLVVAMANPLDESAIMKLRDVSQREITPVVGTPSHIMGAIDNYYGTF